MSVPISEASEQELRVMLREQLLVHLDRDVHISGYMVAFFTRHCPLDQVEQLVDELDAVFLPATRGQRVAAASSAGGGAGERPPEVPGQEALFAP